MDLDVAHGAILAGLEVLHNTTLADCAGKEKQTLRLFGNRVLGLDRVPVWLGQTAQRLTASLVRTRAWKNQPESRTLTSMKTLCDGGSIHEVASAQAADNVLIQVFDLYSDLLLWTHPLVTDHSPQPQPLSLPQLGSRLFRQTPRPNPTPCVVSRVLAPGG